MVDVVDVLADVEAEAAVLDEILAALPTESWKRPTPAPGWSIAHQIGHLAWTDAIVVDAAAAANGDPADFAAFSALIQSGAVTIDSAAAQWAALPPAELLGQWRDGRRRMAASLREVAPGAKLPWLGPPMSATSMATARLMETWAHGQDVADALDIVRQPSERIRHIAHLAVRTRDFAFKLHKLSPPEAEFRIELTSPAGEVWAWGPQDAAERVTGPAEDFCLLATQRRHRDDLALKTVGPNADTWLDIVQTFAGPPGAGRQRSTANNESTNPHGGTAPGSTA